MSNRLNRIREIEEELGFLKLEIKKLQNELDYLKNCILNDDPEPNYPTHPGWQQTGPTPPVRFGDDPKPFRSPYKPYIGDVIPDPNYIGDDLKPIRPPYRIGDVFPDLNRVGDVIPYPFKTTSTSGDF